MIKTSRQSVYVEKKKKATKKSLKCANALYLELLNLGYELTPSLWEAIAGQNPSTTKKISKELLAEFSVGKVNAPLFLNWEDRETFTFDELIVQILGYSFQLCGNDFESKDFRASLKRNVDVKKVRKLRLAQREQAQKYFTKLLSSNVSQDRKTVAKIGQLTKEFPDLVADSIKSDEVRVQVLMNRRDLAAGLADLNCKPADVMRYAAGKVDINTVKLPHDVKFANLKWKERVDSFTFLNGFSFDYLCEGMGMNRGAWSRYLKHTHFFEQKGFVTRFPDFYLAAFASTENRLENAPREIVKDLKRLIKEDAIEVTDGGTLAYRTFNSRIASAIEKKNFGKIKKLCRQRKGYLLRNLSTVMNGITKKNEAKFVALVREFLDDASPDILFSILSIGVDSKYRVIDVKGDTVIQPADYSDTLKDIQGDIKRTIQSRFGVKGKVKVKKELSGNIVPFLSKNSELPRGTRIPIDTKNAFFFMHWVQEFRSRSDLDHSYLAFDDRWNMETVAFYRQANSFLTHGGDITNAPAPNGATEYGKIRLDKAPSNVRYIAPVINVYSGPVFKNLKSARAGFWLSDSDKFVQSSEAIYYNLTEPAEANIPFVVDVKKKELIVTDFNQRNRYGNIAANYATDLKKLISATKSKDYITIGKLAKMLSGDSNKTSLTITATPKGKKEVAPEDLFSLFS